MNGWSMKEMKYRDWTGRREQVPKREFRKLGGADVSSNLIMKIPLQ